MRYSTLFPKTVTRREIGGVDESFSLLERGGFVRRCGVGLFSITPLGMRVQQRIRAVIAEEMTALGGQEVLVPLVSPRELWRRSGRDQRIERDMVRFRDRRGSELVLSPTHEEMLVELVRDGVHSYRDLPLMLFQFQTKFRDEERTRCGMVRAREFLMKDAYSFHRSFSDLNNFFPRVFASYMRIFERCGVPVIPAQAGVGYMEGHGSYEFLMPSSCGEDHLIQCSSCGYAANEEVAVGHIDIVQEALQPLEYRNVPIEESATAAVQYLEVARSSVVKAILFRSFTVPIMAVVRGDYTVSLEKLSQVVGGPIHGLADTSMLKEFGFAEAWVSPFSCRNRRGIGFEW